MTKHRTIPLSRILVTGATGYVGGRLVPRLLSQGHRVRCLVRDPEKLLVRPWSNHPRLEVVQADLSDSTSTEKALSNCDIAYYLVHAMMGGDADYAAQDRHMAKTFAKSAEKAGVRRIVYLGGLGECGDNLSKHLASRREVEQILQQGNVPLTSLRAAMIIGSGSASFEILRYLVQRLPVMITPRWVQSECQPIAIDDVLHYLIACLHTPRTIGQSIDIGGNDVMGYAQIIQCLAQQLGLKKRLIIPLPWLTPRLSSMWIHLVTPISHRIARPLADGLRNRVVCRDDRARTWMPHQPLSIDQAIERACQEQDVLETSWSDAGVVHGDPEWAGGKIFEDSRSCRVRASAESTFHAVADLGGSHGYHGAQGLWRLRGWVDRLLGGPGLGRGRVPGRAMGHGSVVDFWRVSKYQCPHALTLTAEMRLPGSAQLLFQIEPLADNQCRLVQTAQFKPNGLLGFLYWHAVLPLHGIVFRNMLHGLKRAAEQSADLKKLSEKEATA